jgi:hypothetical protein
MTENNLSQEQRDFLASCEAEFKDRYTQADKAFMQVETLVVIFKYVRSSGEFLTEVMSRKGELIPLHVVGTGSEDLFWKRKKTSLFHCFTD